jgi:hypothetical protein
MSPEQVVDTDKMIIGDIDECTVLTRWMMRTEACMKIWVDRTVRKMTRMTSICAARWCYLIE